MNRGVKLLACIQEVIGFNLGRGINLARGGDYSLNLLDKFWNGSSNWATTASFHIIPN
jgi:hypothetical protein